MEIADIDERKINDFVSKWFCAKDPAKAELFIKKLGENKLMQKLATDSQILNLLCLFFEESANLPLKRSNLYEEGIGLLLKKWDERYNVEHEQVYKNLSVKQKEDLLSQIALIAFERDENFFLQQEVQQYIAEYFLNLPNINTEAIHLYSAAVLISIELQHGLLVQQVGGIYSFPHIGFQEYFTARAIITSSNPQSLEAALKKLVSRITQKQWREVFLLTVEVLPSSNYLLQLMKQQVEQLVSQDPQIQVFLAWVSNKSRAVPASCRQVSVRAFYLALELAKVLSVYDGVLSLARMLDGNFKQALHGELALDLALERTLALEPILGHISDPVRVFNCTFDCTLARVHLLAPEL